MESSNRNDMFDGGGKDIGQKRLEEAKNAAAINIKRPSLKPKMVENKDEISKMPVYFANEVGKPLETVRTYDNSSEKILDNANNKIIETSNTSTETSNTSSETSNTSTETSNTSTETSKTSSETTNTSTETTNTSTENSKASSEVSNTSSETSNTSSETSNTSSETSNTSTETTNTSTENSKDSAKNSKDSENSKDSSQKSKNLKSDNTIKNEESSNKNNTSSEESDIEEKLPQIVASSGDPTLPYILKIGQKGYAEYIDLGPMPTRKKPNAQALSFNQFQIGNRIVELNNMYNVYDKNGIIAMQKVFGVKNQHQEPPILKFIVDKCLPSDFNLVRTALEFRLKTLQSRIEIKGDHLSAKADIRRLEWIKDILKRTQTITKICNKKPSKLTIIQPTGCSCLQDLNLLRDLVYIISLLQGVTNPAIKSQLEKITLNRLLKSAKKNVKENPQNILQDIVLFLEKNLDAIESEPSDTTHQRMLKSIYSTLCTIMDKECTVTDDQIVSLDMIFELIRKIQNKMNDNLIQIRACDEQGNQLTEKQNELKELKEQLPNLKNDVKLVNDQLSTFINLVKDELSLSKTENEELNERLSAANKTIDELGEKLNQANQLIDELDTRLFTEGESHSDMINKMTEEYDELINRLKGEISEISSKYNEILGKYQEKLKALEETSENRKRIQNEYDTLLNENKSLMENLTNTLQELSELQDEHKIKLNNLNEALTKINDLQKEVEGLHKDVSDSERMRNVAINELTQLQQKIKECESANQELRKQLAESQERIAIVEKERNNAQSLAKDLEIERDDALKRIKNLEEELENKLLNAKNEVENLQKVLEDQVEKSDEEREYLLNKLREAEEKIKTLTTEKETQLSEKNTQLLEQTKRIEELEKQHETDTSEIEKLKVSVKSAEITGIQSSSQLEALVIERDGLRDTIENLSKDLAEKSDEISNLVISNENYKQRLENLLGIILINPELRNAARQYLDGNNEMLEQLKEQNEIFCDIIKYLLTVINLQVRKLSTILSEPIKNDIFQIYKETGPVDDVALLKELTNLFQELFSNISSKKTIEPSGLSIEGEYPIIVSKFGNEVMDKYYSINTMKYDVDVLLQELGSFGFLSTTIIEPSGIDNQILIKKTPGNQISTEFLKDNKKRVTPVVVLGIKYIQLLSKVFNDKFKSMIEYCGFGDLTIVTEGQPEMPLPPAPLPPPPTSSPPSTKSDALTRAIASLVKSRGDFNTIKAINNAIMTYTRLIQSKSSKDPIYNGIYLELLLGLYKNLYDIKSGGTFDVKLDTPIIKNALNALNYKPNEYNTLDKIKNIMTKIQNNLPQQLK